MISTIPDAIFASRFGAPRAKHTSGAAAQHVGISERERLAGRLYAAKVNGGAAAAQPRGSGRYTVEGRAGARYTVATIGDAFLCDCKAGQYGPNRCWHAAATFLRVVADRALEIGEALS